MPKTMTFRQFVEGKDWFSGASYETDGKTHNVPELARWAQKNLTPTDLPVAQIRNKYKHANNLFVDDEGEWSRRSMRADLSHPILVLATEPKWDIIDGNHRVWKAWKQGLPSVKAYVMRPQDLAGY